LWANCHGGVLLGLVILATGLGIQTLMNPRIWRRTVLTLVGCVLAVTATPLGLAFWTEIPKSLGRIHLYPLDEWRPPRVLDVRLLPFWILAAAFCAALVVNRHRLRRAAAGEATVYGCALVLLPMAVMAIRNVGPFLMIAVPALTSLVPIRFGPSPRADEPRGLLNLSLMSSATLAVAITLAWAYHNRIPRLRWEPVPAGALVALQHCPDNLYNRYDEGGSLLWFAPLRKVFLDGRQDPYPPDLVLEHIRVETGKADYRPVFSRHDIRCAYLPTVSPTAAGLSASGWTTLYRDPHWVVLKSD
jgi:hypothetical protein